MRTVDEALIREREFHDQLAANNDLASIPPRPPDELEEALFDQVGDLSGARVLDLGCGQGDLTIELAKRAREVTALDLSPGMVRAAEARLKRFVTPPTAVSFLVAPAHAIPVPDSSFDVVVGKWIIHHVDLDQLAPELVRVLNPGGRAVFIENSGDNPVLRFFRERVTGRMGVRRIGTADEHPIRARDLDAFRPYFGRVESTFPQFDFFTLFDRQILRFRYRAVTRLCVGLDRLIYRRVPPLRRYSFRFIVTLEEPRH